MSDFPYDFSYDEFKKQYKFLDNSKFGIYYDEFKDETEYYGNPLIYCTEIKRTISSPHDENLILKFFHNLYKINVKINGLQDHLFNELPETDKTYCSSLKYWLYEEIGKMDPKGQEIDKNFQKLKELLDSKIQGKLSVPCTFNELKWDEHQKLKSIYAFLLIYYSNIDAFNEYKNIECKYMDYLGKGLKEYHDTLKRCSEKTKQSNYCKEFNELNEIYKEDYIHWKTSTADNEYIYYGDDTVNCALQIESLKDPLHLSYWNKKEKLHLINYPFNSQKSAVISTSSAIGATAGISLFLIYLYKKIFSYIFLEIP
ncbi:PIR Superfamily Protein [Plasmodium ovale wallikeri]|uniref:PIR Superfamily Protein n=1 Tax=Plasmodium ovale wallikeri TaxID=864142 RepID=A0A1A9ART8_PLAOA|nr:PIR Superfamily Protein [Plasmodium ovale wallikeri]